MTDKPTYQCGTPERGIVSAWEGEVAGLQAEVKRLQDALDEALYSLCNDQYTEQQAVAHKIKSTLAE